MKTRLYTCLIILTAFSAVIQSKAQEICETSFDSYNSTLFNGSTLLDGLCIEIEENFTLGCDPEMYDGEFIPESWIEGVLENPQKWNRIPANTDITVYVEFRFVQPITLPGSPHIGLLNPFDEIIQVNWRGEEFLVELQQIMPSLTSSGSDYSFLFGEFTFNSGPAIVEGDMSTGLEINFTNILSDNPGYEAATWMFIEGDGIVSDPEWTTTAPAVPQIILRDPPGDGSFTELLQGDETCHGHAVSVSTDESNSEWGSVRLGVSGEVGFLYSTEVETYVEVSSGMEMGFVHTTVDESKLCVKVENSYSTSIDDPIFEENGGDLYIGSSITYAYGVFKIISMDETCEIIEENSLAFLPISSNGFFIYPEGYITGTIIPELEENLETFEPSSDEYRLVADQLEVWEEYVQMNTDIKAEALAIQVPSNLQFLAGSSTTNSVTTTTSEMRSVEHNMYIEETAAMEAGVYVAGSGGSLGAQIRSRTTKGSTETSSNVHSTEISYTFNDDDAGTGSQDGDVFSVDIYQDLTFGTPIFDLVEFGSATSCPYEGGYLIDNPGISFSNGDPNELSVSDIPDGETFTFEVDICNESEFDREYFVYVPLESNLNGLQVSLAGTPINVTDGVTTGVIPGNTCLEGVDVTISQTEGSPELNYEDVKITVFTPCQPDFEPSIAEVSFDAFFNASLSIDEAGSNSEDLSIFPNPNDGRFSVRTDKLQNTGTLQIHDLSGRLIHQEVVNLSNGVFDLEMNEASSGLYLLSIFNREEKITEKFSIK